MKKVLKLLALTALVPVTVMAQTSLDEEVNAELERMYQTQLPQASRTAGPAVQVNVQAQPQVSATQSNNQGTTQSAGQFSGQSQNSVQAQKQPTTVIQASPLVESKADFIRRNRQDAEVSTEQTIVEKLEQSRLEDEKKRAEVLFGDKFNTLMNQGAAQSQTQTQTQTQTQAVVVAPAPVAAPTVAPAPMTPVVPVVPAVIPEQRVSATPEPVVVEKEAETFDRESIRGEISTALQEFKKEDEKPSSSSYFSMMAGSGDYPDAVNVRGQYSLGAAFGRKFNDRIVAEGSFLFSNYQVEQPPAYGNGGQVYNYQTGQYEYYPRITDMNQYATSALVKYQLLGGLLRPEVGGLVSYTYRTFSDKQFAITDATLSSHSLDFGVMTGASVELSDAFSIGLDFRYMWNMTSKQDGSSLQRSSLYGTTTNYTPIEELSYYNFSVVGRATF